MRKLNAIVMTLAGGLLVVAAILKVHEGFNVYIPSWQEKGVWESWEFFLVQIPVEFALGVWMVSGLFRKAAWVGGVVAYAIFIGVTLYKGFSGAESCGCFGQVQVNPWITLFAIDIPFFVLLAVFYPRHQRLLPPPWPHVGHAIVTAVPVFAALIFISPLLVAFRPEFIKPEDWAVQTPPVRPQVVQPQVEPEQPELTPESIVEPEAVQPEPEQVSVEPVLDTTQARVQEAVKEEPKAQTLWPWLEHIDIAEQMKEGIVITYLYHHDCPTCAESVPKYEAYSKKMGDEEFRIAYVAIPPYGREGEGPVPADTACLHGKLTDKQKWAITSPFVVALIDGAVVKTWPQGTSPQPEAILDEIFGH